MLKAYLDFGQKRHPTADSVVCVGSVVFKPTPYKQFLRPWSRMLKRWGASAFHATDFYSGGGEFKRDTQEKQQLFDHDSRSLPAMIARHVEHVLMVSFKPDEFNRVASEQWKAAFGTSVHSHAVQLCLIANGWWRHAKCPTESFAYFMESGDEDEGEISKTVERMRNDRGTGTDAVIRVASFARVNKGSARGLEAADFVAWHWNKYYMDKMRVGDDMNPRKDFAAFAGIAKDKLKYIFASGAYLQYFFSLVPPDVVKAQAAAKVA